MLSRRRTTGNISMILTRPLARPLSVALSMLASLPACLAAPPQDPIGKFDTIPEAGTPIFRQDVAWSPNSKWIGYSEIIPTKDAPKGTPLPTRIILARADGSGEKTTIDKALWVSFSPDGRRVAFSSNRDGNSEIYTAKIDGSDLHRLTNNPANDSAPAWGSTGRIAFASNRDGKRRLYTMAEDGSDLRQVTPHDPDSDDFNPAWNADGSLLVFYRERGDSKDQVFTVKPDGSALTRITDGTHHNTFPGFLRDGRFIFHRSEGGESKDPGALVAFDPATGQPKELTSENAFFARQSPDGKHIAFISGHFPRTAAYIAEITGAPIRRVSE